jgi:hypothetical protein
MARLNDRVFFGLAVADGTLILVAATLPNVLLYVFAKPLDAVGEG